EDGTALVTAGGREGVAWARHSDGPRIAGVPAKLGILKPHAGPPGGKQNCFGLRGLQPAPREGFEPSTRRLTVTWRESPTHPQTPCSSRVYSVAGVGASGCVEAHETSGKSGRAGGFPGDFRGRCGR